MGMRVGLRRNNTRSAHEVELMQLNLQLSGFAPLPLKTLSSSVLQQPIRPNTTKRRGSLLDDSAMASNLEKIENPLKVIEVMVGSIDDDFFTPKLAIETEP